MKKDYTGCVMFAVIASAVLILLIGKLVAFALIYGALS